MTRKAFVEQSFPGKPTAEHRARFERDGFLAFEGVLSAVEVEKLKAALSASMQRFHQLAVSGEGSYTPPREGNSNYDGANVGPKSGGGRMQWQAGYDPLKLTPEESELKVRNFYFFDTTDPLFGELVKEARLKGFIEALLGEETLLFQTMALSKPPFIGTEKPWHQDNAYFSYTPLEKIAGVWIALDEAKAENGCMHVLPGMTGHALKHRNTFDCEIIPDRIPAEKIEAVELKPGGVLFFSGMLPHETPTNRSPLRRRAMQFHYRGVSTKAVPKPEYDKEFAEADGTPGSCAVANEDRERAKVATAER